MLPRKLAAATDIEKQQLLNVKKVFGECTGCAPNSMHLWRSFPTSITIDGLVPGFSCGCAGWEWNHGRQTLLYCSEWETCARPLSCRSAQSHPNGYREAIEGSGTLS